MVEPSDNLQAVFEKAIDTAKKLHHEYLTIEHLLFAMLLDESFSNSIKGFGSDSEQLKQHLSEYLQTKCSEITIEDIVVKPKKTQSVERVLNKAFTQVLFNGRQRIEPTDVFLAMMSEKRSWAHFYISEADIQKEKFNEYLNNTAEIQIDEDGNQQSGNDKALAAFTTNLNEQVKKNKIDPVIGRVDELENIALAMGRRSKNNVILVGDPGVGKTAIAEGLPLILLKVPFQNFLKTTQFLTWTLVLCLQVVNTAATLKKDLKQLLKPYKRKVRLSCSSTKHI